MVDFLLGLFGVPMILILSFLIVSKEKQQWVVDGLCSVKYDLGKARKRMKFSGSK